nr:ribonuclease H-like domain-containing protein [Tanacetum cinerariifolium]
IGVEKGVGSSIIRCDGPEWKNGLIEGDMTENDDFVDGSLSRYTAHLIANGNSQKLCVDYDETFSSMVKPATIRTVLSLATSWHWLVHQLDVKNDFLHGTLSETVYMHQPPGF